MTFETDWPDPYDLERDPALRAKALSPPQHCFLSAYHPASQQPDQWVLGPVILHRDSGLLEQSNSRVLLRRLESLPEFEEVWEVHELGHWAVGWVKHLSFQLFDEGGTKPTAIYVWLREWFAKLEDYPLADEDDYSALECEATYENVKSAVSMYRYRYLGDRDLDHEAIHTWLQENTPNALDNRDDQGGWPSDEAIAQAVEALYGPATENE